MEKLNKKCTKKQYAEFANFANENGLQIGEMETEYVLLKDYEAIRNEVVVDISLEEEYLNKKAEIKKREIQEKINDLDKKRIRAIAEPEMKNENQSWLEFYTQEIQLLRAQM